MDYRKLAIIFTAIGIAFWFPITRAAILFILPLGSGFDDLLFIGFLIGGVGLLAYNKTVGLPPMTRSRWLFVLIIVFSFTVAAILYSMFI